MLKTLPEAGLASMMLLYAFVTHDEEPFEFPFSQKFTPPEQIIFADDVVVNLQSTSAGRPEYEHQIAVVTVNRGDCISR